MLDQQTAGVGHNNPPDDIKVLNDTLKEDNKDRLERTAKLIAGVDKVPEKLEDEEKAQKAVIFVAQIKTAIKDANGARLAAKKPYDNAGKAVQSFFNVEILNPLDAAAKNVQSKIDERLREQDRIRREREAEERRRREEEQRRAAEEAKRLEAEGKAFAAEQAQEKAAALEKEAAKADRQAAKNTAVKSSEFGVNASARTVKAFEIQDTSKIDFNLLRDHFTQAELEKAIRSFIRDGGEVLLGVHIYETVKSTVRTK